MAALTLSVLLLLTVTSSVLAADSRCAEPASGAGSGAGASQSPLGEAGGEEVKLTATAQKFAFGEGRDVARRTITLKATPPLPADAKPIVEVAGDLEGGGSSFPFEAIGASAKVTPLGAVQLKICLDPEQPEKVGRGSYIGAIQVGGTGIETATVPLEATLRSSIWIALLLALVGMAFGLALKMFADLNKDPNAQVKLSGIKEYVTRGAFFTAVFLGFAGVGLSLWQLYDVNPSWGDAADLFKIFAAGVGLQVTGATAVDFFSPFKSSFTPNPPNPPAEE